MHCGHVALCQRACVPMVSDDSTSRVIVLPVTATWSVYREHHVVSEGQTYGSSRRSACLLVVLDPVSKFWRTMRQDEMRVDCSLSNMVQARRLTCVTLHLILGNIGTSVKVELRVLIKHGLLYIAHTVRFQVVPVYSDKCTGGLHPHQVPHASRKREYLQNSSSSLVLTIISGVRHRMCANLLPSPLLNFGLDRAYHQYEHVHRESH